MPGSPLFVRKPEEQVVPTIDAEDMAVIEEAMRRGTISKNDGAILMELAKRQAPSPNTLANVGRRGLEQYDQMLNSGEPIDAARLFLQGLGPGAVGAARAASAPSLAARAERMKEFGIDPTIATVAQGSAPGVPNRAAQVISGAMQATPVTGQPVVAGAQRTINQLEGAAQAAAGKIGQPLTEAEAGFALKEGVASAAGRVERVPYGGAVVPGVDFVKKNYSGAPSWFQRGRDLYEKARLPDGYMIKTDETMAALEEILYPKGVRPGVSSQVRNARLERLYTGLKDGRASQEELRLLGDEANKLAAETDASRSLSSAQAGKLYGAIKNDIYRAADKIGKGDALREADSFWADGKNKINNVLGRIFKAQTPEAAYNAFEAALRDEKGNIAMVSAAKEMLPEALWNDLAATAVSRLGQPTGRAVPGVTFSATNYFSNYSKLSPAAKKLLFSPENKKYLDELQEIVGRQGNVDRLADTGKSGSYQRLAPYLGTAGAGAAAVYNPLATALSIGGVYLTAAALNSPAVLKGLAAIGKATPKNAGSAVRSLISSAAFMDGQDKFGVLAFARTYSRLHPELSNDPEIDLLIKRAMAGDDVT